MSKIIGITVGTPISPQTMKDKLHPVLSVNGMKPDESGNISIKVVNGKDGYTPIKGVDYFDGKDGEDGKDGYTPVKGVDYFDGSNGKDGADGYTPIKGTDYFTDADKTELVAAVLAEIPNGDGVNY